jgi:hypothetical protein
MAVWLILAVLVAGLVVAGGWALRDTTGRTDLLRRHDPHSAATVEQLGELWNPATLPMRDRAFDPPQY